MQTFLNTYHPQTPVGAAIQNIAQALFSGPSPADEARLRAQEEQRLSAAALNRARIASELARQRNIDSEVATRDANLSGRQNMLGNAISALVGEDDSRDVRRYLQGQDASLAFESGRAPRPSVLTPESEGHLRRVQRVAPLAMASTTANPYQLQQAIDSLYRQDEGRRLAGVSPGERTAAAAGNFASGFTTHAPFTGQREGSTNVLTGEQTINPIGTADIGRMGAQATRDRAHAGLYGEQAKTQGVQRNLLNARINALNAPAEQSTVEYRMPNGETIMVTPSLYGDLVVEEVRSAGRERVAGTRGAGRQQGVNPRDVVKPTPQDEGMILGTIKMLTEGASMEPADNAAVSARAKEYFSTPGSQAYKNHTAAAQLALQDVFGEEPPELGGMYGFRTLRPRGGGESRRQFTPLMAGPIPQVAAPGPGRGPSVASSGGASAESIRADFRAGRITREQARERLRSLGMQD